MTGVAPVPDELAFSEISDLAVALRRGSVSSVELVRLMLERISQFDTDLKAFLAVNPNAVQEAEEAHKNLKGGMDRGPLHGIPLSVKDLILTHDMDTTAGSRAFYADRQSDAVVVTRLRQAGAIIIGKTNLHEFAFGITNENEHFGAVQNPWKPGHISGGSSGGSAAALAAGLCYGSIGTDTRGSIRIPSSCCGVVGLKPTLGLVPTEGVIPLSRTLDHVGPMARSVRDAALLLSAMTSRPFPKTRLQEQDLEKSTMGVCPYYFDGIDPIVRQVVEACLQRLGEAGMPVVEVRVDGLDEALEASDVISRAEALAFHQERLTENPDGYGPHVRDRILSGRLLSPQDLAGARKVRSHITAEFERVFRTVDCLVAPGLTVTAPQLGVKSIETNGRAEPVVHNFVRLHAPQNMAGVPALVFPIGFSPDGLPIGIQLIGAQGRDNSLLMQGQMIQEVIRWRVARPPLYS